MGELCLSIIIPAYNEERFIGTLLEKVHRIDFGPLGLRKEIIVVDDGSSDRTVEIASTFSDVRVEVLDRNRGKGFAVRRGLALANGDFLIIQDADLEYDPSDYLPMLSGMLSGDADAVYGSRYLGGWIHSKRPTQSWTAYFGGRSLSLAALLATGYYLTDTVTALKLFKKEVKNLPLQTAGFETDHEITALLLAQGKRIKEVPISYLPRSKAEGKKIGVRDWFLAVRTLWRYRKG